ncbi:DUF3618 domain-containing protein [Aeromicrobium sp. Leaf350]|uniref:DUF3618 domain-containing protein n=1 Tax=Aeromicrobium sp. Leaf350 TaxID=2876565 RepID=UPI001E2B3552|nr:DUF3618 domain-containing protein [Aeromicrobium sp. Leaf350]
MSDRPGPGASAKEIRADIEQTREQLADTVDALGAKVSPANVAAQAKHGAAERWPQLAVLAVTAVAIVVAWRKL